MNRTRHLALALATAAATLCGPPAAAAATAYYTFSGVVDANHTEYATLTTFSGLFSFEPTTPDVAPGDPDNGAYPMDSGLYGLSFSFDGGAVFVTDPMHYFLAVHVPSATIFGQTPDHGHFDVDGAVSGQIDRFVGLSFRKAFLTDALPGSTGDLTLASFDEALFTYTGLAQIAPGPGDPVVPPYGAFGHLTALTCVDGCVGVGATPPNAVPEPTTMALLFAGLALPGVLFRRRGAGRRAA